MQILLASWGPFSVEQEKPVLYNTTMLLLTLMGIVFTREWMNTEIKCPICHFYIFSRCSAIKYVEFYSRCQADQLSWQLLGGVEDCSPPPTSPSLRLDSILPSAFTRVLIHINSIAKTLEKHINTELITSTDVKCFCLLTKKLISVHRILV